MSLSRTQVYKHTAAAARSSRIQNVFKGGMSVMGWAKGPGAAAGCVINVYGSSDPGTRVGTGQGGDGNPQQTDDTSKQVLVATVHPTTASVGATGTADTLPNVICYWDYLFYEVVSLESTTNQIELTLSGADRA